MKFLWVTEISHFTPRSSHLPTDKLCWLSDISGHGCARYQHDKGGDWKRGTGQKCLLENYRKFDLTMKYILPRITLVLLQVLWSLAEDVEEVCQVEEGRGDAHHSHGSCHLLAAPADVLVGDGRGAWQREHGVVGQARHSWYCTLNGWEIGLYWLCRWNRSTDAKICSIVWFIHTLTTHHQINLKFHLLTLPLK